MCTKSKSGCTVEWYGMEPLSHLQQFRKGYIILLLLIAYYTQTYLYVFSMPTSSAAVAAMNVKRCNSAA